MKRNRFLAAAALALGLFFLLQFGAEIFYSIGKDKVPEKGLKSLQTGMKLFPFTSAGAAEAGFSLLEKGTRDNATATLKESIPYFLAAARANPLEYQARYYLAKAYLRLSKDNGTYFDMAVEELKRAAHIRGGNPQIALDCAKVFFSIWPLLEKADQRFVANLLADAMPALAWKNFSPLLEAWSLYVQDAPLLMTLLERRPDFFGSAANQLVNAGIPLAWRWQLLDMYEAYSLDSAEKLFNEKLLNNEMDWEQARQLFRHLDIKGYFRLQPGSQFKHDRLAQFQRQLLLEIISGSLSYPRAKAEPNAELQLRGYIQTFLSEHPELNSLEELQNVLEEKKFFKENDFPSLRLKTLISYRKGDYNGVIAEIEALRKGISFVKQEQAADYTDILLLLVDSYYSSKLLTVAETVARDLYLSQPDNPDVLYRIRRVQKVLGDEGAPDKALNEKLAKVESSRFLTVARANSGYDVFLFNQPQIEIVLDPALRAQLKAGQLLQVFINDRIAYESYVETVPEKIVIGPPFTDVERKVRVQVIILN